MVDNSIKYEDASKYSGWLQKESPGLLKNYQKRFFSILNGRFLVYSEKEGTEVKGTIDLKEAITDGKLENVKNFLVKYGDREFKLKAENETEKLKWIKVINCINEFNNRNVSVLPTNQYKLEDIPEKGRSATRIVKNMHKIQNLEADALTVKIFM